MVSHAYMHVVGMVAVVTGWVLMPNFFRIWIRGRRAAAACSLRLSTRTALRLPPPTLEPSIGAERKALRAACWTLLAMRSAIA